MFWVQLLLYLLICVLSFPPFFPGFSEGSSQAIKNDNKANTFGGLEV